MAALGGASPRASIRPVRLLPFLLLATLLVAAPTLAQQQPPARVGRVSIVEGTLAFYGPGDTDWSAAKLNFPVAESGWFATDPDSRAELRIGTASIKERLKEIIQTEKMQADDEALEMIARRAGGSMRDAQSLLDQLLAFGSDRLGAGTRGVADVTMQAGDGISVTIVFPWSS